MVQGLNQQVQAIQNSQAQRCRPTRRGRPLLSQFPAFFYANKDLLTDPKDTAPGAIYTTQTYNFIDTRNNTNQTGIMGDKMEVIIFPKAFQNPGSSPGKYELETISNFLRFRYPVIGFIKGHMWNQEIGGPGITQNLVPLSAAANSAHKTYAEAPLKQALTNFQTFYEITNRNNKNDPDWDKLFGFRYIVEVEDQWWNAVSENIVPNSIHVQVFPLELRLLPNNTYQISPNPGITRAIPPGTTTLPRIQALINGIWIDQTGTVHP